MPPKKRPQPKAKKVKLSKRAEWQQILKEVDKDEVPVSVLQYIKVNLEDGTIVDINIQELLAEGYSPEEVQSRLNERLSSLDEYIVDVDFFIDIDATAAIVQNVTNILLKNL